MSYFRSNEYKGVTNQAQIYDDVIKLDAYIAQVKMGLSEVNSVDQKDCTFNYGFCTIKSKGYIKYSVNIQNGVGNSLGFIISGANPGPKGYNVEVIGKGYWKRIGRAYINPIYKKDYWKRIGGAYINPIYKKDLVVDLEPSVTLKDKIDIIITNTGGNDMIIYDTHIDLSQFTYKESGSYISEKISCYNSSQIKAFWQETRDVGCGIDVKFRLYNTDGSITTADADNNIGYTSLKGFDSFQLMVDMTTTNGLYTPTFKLINVITDDNVKETTIDKEFISKKVVDNTIDNLLFLASLYQITDTIIIEKIKELTSFKQSSGTVINIKEYNGMVDVINYICGIEKVTSNLSKAERNKTITSQILNSLNASISSLYSISPTVTVTSAVTFKTDPVTFVKLMSSNNDVGIVNCSGPGLSGYIKKDPVVYGDGVIGRISFSPDGNYFVQAYSPQYSGNSVTVYMKVEDSFVFVSNYQFSSLVWHVSWESNGNIYVATANGLSECIVEDGVITSETIITTDIIGRMVMSPDGKWMATVDGWGGYGVAKRALRLCVYTINEDKSFTLVYTYQSERQGYATVEFSPSSKWIYVGQSGDIMSDSLLIFQVGDEITLKGSYTPITNENNDKNGVIYISCPKDSEYIYLLCHNTICLGRINDETGEIIILYKEDAGATYDTCLGFGTEAEMRCSPDGNFCGVAHRDYTNIMARLYKREGNSLTKLTWNPGGAYTTSIAFTPDSRYMAFGTKGGGTNVIRIMDTHIKEEDICVSVKDNKYIIQWALSDPSMVCQYGISTTGYNYEIYVNDGSNDILLYSIENGSILYENTSIELRYLVGTITYKVIGYNKLGNRTEKTGTVVIDTNKINSYKLWYQNLSDVWKSVAITVDGNKIETSIVPGFIDYKLEAYNASGQLLLSKAFQVI